MVKVISKRIPKKISRRALIVDGIIDGLTSPSVWNTIDDGRSEARVTSYLHQTILESLRRLHKLMDQKAGPELVDKRARKSLLWEGDIHTTVNNIQFLGAQHRPDFVVLLDDTRVALEVKRGSTGSTVRDALGQCLVYVTDYDFACCILVDTTPDKKLKRAFQQGEPERIMLERLWQEFNIRIAVV